MPEGDTIHGTADRLNAALAGKAVARAGGSHRQMIQFGERVRGATVDEVVAHGKHVLIHFANGWTLRTHMQMTGVWHVYGLGEPWRKSPGKARVVLETADSAAVCYAAPTVQLAPKETVLERIGRLGPDLMIKQDFAELAVRIVTEGGDRTICDVIVDQAVVAGLGNVYKSELLFVGKVHPDTPTAKLGTTAVAALLEKGHIWLSANRGKARSTTGARMRGQTTWVYGRASMPCRRCGTAIEYAKRGPLARDTYWCPRCQPAPT